MGGYRPPKHRTSFGAFPVAQFGTPGVPSTYFGTFRNNVRALVSEIGIPQSSEFPGVSAWVIPLEDPAGHRIDLRVWEEKTIETERQQHCDHCRVIGWGHHPVSVARYHFVIRADADAEGWGGGVGKGHKLCQNCGLVIPASMKKCSSCGAAAAARSAVLESHSHLLHGCVHSNGFGHLLRINGRERGSRVLSGSQLMGLWDRICNLLCARQVSVMDKSSKHGLDFRLLHAAAYGQSWYATYGYRFARGSFSTDEMKYCAAVAAIQTAELEGIINRPHGLDEDLVSILRIYSQMAPTPIPTLGSLLRFQLELLRQLPRQPLASSPSPSPGTPPQKDIAGEQSTRVDESGGGGMEGPALRGALTVGKRGVGEKGGGSRDGMGHKKGKRCYSQLNCGLVTLLVAQILRAAEDPGGAEGGGWMLRMGVRDKVRERVGDLGLVDHVLGSVGEKEVGDRKIVRQKVGRSFQFRSEPIRASTQTPVQVAAYRNVPEVPPQHLQTRLTRAKVESHLKRVVESILGVQSRISDLSQASTWVLNVKQFVKDYEKKGGKGSLKRKLGQDARASEPGEERRQRLSAEARSKNGRRQNGGGGNKIGHKAMAEDRTARIHPYTQPNPGSQTSESTARGAGVEEAEGCGSEGEGVEVACVAVLGAGGKSKGVVPPQGGWRNPPEAIVRVPRGGSVGQLMEAASQELRETYVIFSHFKAQAIEGLPRVLLSDPLDMHLPSLLEFLCLHGKGVDLASPLRAEGGGDDWVVNCVCGTRDDDGERMVACDRCQAWHHTRCTGTRDGDPPPLTFMCQSCKKSTKKGGGGGQRAEVV